MMTRIRCAVVATLATLALASACLAQEAVPPATPGAITLTPDSTAHADSTVAKAAPAKAHRTAGDAAGRAGIGALIGGSYFYAAQDFSQGALPRWDFSGHWRYSFSDRWRGQISIGFTWAAYDKNTAAPFTSLDFPTQTSKEGFLTQLVPTTAQLQYRFGNSKWNYHIGAGPGLYRVVVQDERKVQKDPVTLEVHQNTWWGVSGEVGMEKFARTLPSTSFEINAVTHFVFAKDDVRFPSGFSSNLGAFAIRMGVNYYFDTAMLKKKTPEALPHSGGGKKK
jgi:hypothetical protein